MSFPGLSKELYQIIFYCLSSLAETLNHASLVLSSNDQAAIFTDIDLETAIQSSDQCHNHQRDIAFIKAEMRGVFGVSKLLPAIPAPQVFDENSNRVIVQEVPLLILQGMNPIICSPNPFWKVLKICCDRVMVYKLHENEYGKFDSKFYDHFKNTINATQVFDEESERLLVVKAPVPTTYAINSMITPAVMNERAWKTNSAYKLTKNDNVVYKLHEDEHGKVSKKMFKVGFDEDVFVAISPIEFYSCFKYTKDAHRVLDQFYAKVMDAASLFKMLSRGKLRCIGATTLEQQYMRYVEDGLAAVTTGATPPKFVIIDDGWQEVGGDTDQPQYDERQLMRLIGMKEKDAASERRFQQVYVAGPCVLDTINILRGLKERYEGHHGVRIQDRALVVAAQLSSRYIAGRHLHDKAIDLVDDVCANVRLQLDSQPEEMDNLERKRMQLEIELHALEKEKSKASKARFSERCKTSMEIVDSLSIIEKDWELNMLTATASTPLIGGPYSRFSLLGIFVSLDGFFSPCEFNNFLESESQYVLRCCNSLVQSEMMLWPFNVLYRPGHKPIIAVDYKGEEKKITEEGVEDEPNKGLAHFDFSSQAGESANASIVHDNSSEQSGMLRFDSSVTCITSDYVNAKFFVIKSYSENDVYKSIKYSVWSSILNENKKLCIAYDDARRIAGEEPKGCPIFFFFSANASGQFSGVAEMTEAAEFHKAMNFRKQDVPSILVQYEQQTTSFGGFKQNEFKFCEAHDLPKVIVAKNMVMAWYWSVVTLVFDPGAF